MWQLAEAKNRFSEVFTRAIKDGPQTITRRGEAVVVISKAEYDRLAKPRMSFGEFLLSGPGLDGIDEDLRDRSEGRPIDLG